MIRLLLIALLSINIFAYDRIIALSPSINEIIYALGDGDKIIGNSQFCNFPQDAKSKPKVGGYFTPNLEKIISLNPDIVVMQQSSIRLSKKLNRLGLKTKLFKVTTLEDIKTTIFEIGEMLNKKQEANSILNIIDMKLNGIQNIIKNQKILIAIGHPIKLDKRVYVVGDNLYMNDIINISGNQNAFAKKGGGQPVLNMENIISCNPDIVIVLAPYRIEKNLTIKQLIKPWLELPINAAKTNKIYILDKEYSGIASHRLQYYLEDFKRFLEDAKTK
jgi:iron complex transport system substrate-binding protein